MRYGALFPYAGARPLQEYFNPANDIGGGVTGMTAYAGPGSAPNFMPAGAIVPAFDNYWGAVEFMYAQASATIAAWGLCAITPALVSGRFQFQAAPVANAANQVRPLGVAIQQMAANQFGWFAVGGLVPVNSTASVAAVTPLGIAGVGQAGADSAGKEIENALNILPATTAVVKNCFVTANQPFILVTGNNTIDGIFIGAAVSGAGIPAGAVVQTIDPDGRRFTLSAGPGVAGAAVNPTATGGVALTFTYNDGTNFYNIAHINRPFAQGRIT
jgi:hypothetical protein